MLAMHCQALLVQLLDRRGVLSNYREENVFPLPATMFDIQI
jgi:hypothetical protein